MNKFTLLKEESSLLIIDVQEKLVPAMKYGKQVIEKINILVSAAKEMNMPIMVTEQYPKGLGGTVEEVNAGLENALKLEKNFFSACAEEKIVAAFKETGRKKIIVTGTETHICVFQTVRDLIGLGYEVFVVSDGVASRTKENYKNGLDLMKNMGAVVVNTETILFDLMKKSGTPEFKALSRLIK
ncbi:hydrolase [Clostridium sp. JNZ J1-5]